MSNVLTFIGWMSSSLLFVGALAMFQANRSHGLVIMLLLFGILCLPPLYKITQKWEVDGWAWNIVSRLGLLLLIPAFLAPWISKQDLSVIQPLQNPFATSPTPRKTSQPKIVASTIVSPSPAPVTVVGAPLPILNPLELKKGQTYLASGQLPIFPSNDSNDPVANINKMQLIPAGGSFQVLATKPEKDQIWYQVAAFDQEKRAVDQGWISSKKIAQELASPTLIPSMTPSAVASGVPTPQPSSSLSAILAKMPSPLVAPGSPQVLPSSLAPSLSSTTPAKSTRSTPNSPKNSGTVPAKLPKSVDSAFKLPSTVMSTNFKAGVPNHRVSSEPMPNGSRIVIETTDPNISAEQCKALVKTYMSKAKGKGEIIVYKPNPKPPWKGRVLAFCINELDKKGTVMKNFW